MSIIKPPTLNSIVWSKVKKQNTMAITLESHIKRVLSDGGTFSFLMNGLSEEERKQNLLETLSSFEKSKTIPMNGIELGYKINK